MDEPVIERNNPDEAGGSGVKPGPPAAVVAEPLEVKVVQATGVRKVRGVPRTVSLPHYKVFADGVLAAVTSLNRGKAVLAVAEILPEEESAICEAVAKHRGDEETPILKRPPKVEGPKED